MLFMHANMSTVLRNIGKHLTVFSLSENHTSLKTFRVRFTHEPPLEGSGTTDRLLVF